MNPELLDTFHTPLPGQPIVKVEAQKIIEAFLCRFRPVDPKKISSNLPTPCTLQGRIDGDALNAEWFLRKSSILFFIDSDILNRTNPTEVVDYLKNREPWEDYDICLFDETLTWCIGLTHNDKLIVVC